MGDALCKPNGISKASLVMIINSYTHLIDAIETIFFFFF